MAAKRKKTEQLTIYLSDDTATMFNLLDPILPHSSRAAFGEAAIRKELFLLLDSDVGLKKRVMRALQEHISALEKI